MKKLFFVKFIVFLIVSICTVVNAEQITSTQNPQQGVLPLEITQKTGEELSISKLDLIIDKIENQDKQLDKSNGSNGVAIIVALIAAFVTIIGSIMTYKSNNKTRVSAEKSSKSSNDVLEKISVVESKTQDKQRLVEVISSQRVEWINNVRTLFAEFNTNSYKFTSAIRQAEVQHIGPSSDTNSIIPMLIHNIEMIELYLNPTEVVSKKLIKVCNSIINELSDATIKMASPHKGEIWKMVEKSYNSRKSNLLYFQQVILKSEWKRVKAETDIGKQLSKKELISIIIEVAENLDSRRYNAYLKEELENEYEKIEYEESTKLESTTQTNYTGQNELIKKINQDREFRLLYNIKEIYKYFKPAFNLDYYDNIAMENFVQNEVGKFNVEELNTMLDTVKSDINSNNVIHSNTTNNINSIIALISTICAVIVAFYVALLSFLISKGQLEFVQDSLSFMYWIIGLILFFIIFISILSFIYTKKYTKLNKLQKIIQITITIKKAELMRKK